MNLITAQEFATFRNISKKYDKEKVEESIEHAQYDLRELMGKAFYFDVLQNSQEEGYKDLLDGSEYKEEGFTMKHGGVKALLADLTFARYIYNINNTQTPFGLVQKQYDDGQQVDRNMIKDIAKQTAIDADRNWQLIEGYLEANKEKFPIYFKAISCKSSPNTFKQSRFTFISTNK